MTETITFQSLLDNRCDGGWYTRSSSWVQRHLDREVIQVFDTYNRFAVRVQGLTTGLPGFRHQTSPKRFSVRRVSRATARIRGARWKVAEMR